MALQIFVVPDSSKQVTAGDKLVVHASDIYTQENTKSPWVASLQATGIERLDDETYILLVSVSLGRISPDFKEQQGGATYNRQAHGVFSINRTPELDFFYEVSRNWSGKPVRIRHEAAAEAGIESIKRFELIGNKEMPWSQGRQAFGAITRSSICAFEVEVVQLEEAINGFGTSYQLTKLHRNKINFALPGTANSVQMGAAVNASSADIMAMLESEPIIDDKSGVIKPKSRVIA